MVYTKHIPDCIIVFTSMEQGLPSLHRNINVVVDSEDPPHSQYFVPARPLVGMHTLNCISIPLDYILHIQVFRLQDCPPSCLPAPPPPPQLPVPRTSSATGRHAYSIQASRLSFLFCSSSHPHSNPLSLHPPTMGEGAITGEGGQAGRGEDVSIRGARLL